GSGAGEVQVFGASCLMRATMPGGAHSYIHADGTSASQAVKDDNGKFVASVHADDREAYLQSAAGGTRRYLSVYADGIWVKTPKGAPPGYFMHYNLEETAQDSGWINQSYPSGMSRPHGALFARRDMGKRTWWRGRFQKSSGKFKAGVATVLFTLKASDRPEYTTGIITPSQGTSITRIEVSAVTGEVTARPGADTTWVSIDGLFIDQ